MSVRAHKLVLYIFPHPTQFRRCHGCVTAIEYCYQNGTMNTDVFYFYSLQRLNTDVIRGQNQTFKVIRRHTARATQSTCSTRYCCDNATISSSFKLFDAFGVQLNFSGGATLLSFTNMTVITFNKASQRRFEENETISYSSLKCTMGHPFLLRFKIGTLYIISHPTVTFTTFWRELSVSLYYQQLTTQLTLLSLSKYTSSVMYF